MAIGLTNANLRKKLAKIKVNKDALYNENTNLSKYKKDKIISIIQSNMISVINEKKFLKEFDLNKFLFIFKHLTW